MTDSMTQGERLDEWLEDFKRGAAAKARTPARAARTPDERDEDPADGGHEEESR